MQAKPEIRKKAIALRKRGLSYNEILDSLEQPVAKSTLSYWLRSVKLTTKQQQRLAQRKLTGGRNGCQAGADANRHSAKEKRLQLLNTAREEFSDITLDFNAAAVAGAALFWAEGSKTRNSFNFSNTDPALIKFFLAWCKRVLGVGQDELHARIQVYLTNGLMYKQIVYYWSGITGIPESAFTKPTINPPRRRGKNQKRGEGKRLYGILTITVLNAQKHRANYFALVEKLGYDPFYFVDIG